MTEDATVSSRVLALRVKLLQKQVEKTKGDSNSDQESGNENEETEDSASQNSDDSSQSSSSHSHRRRKKRGKSKKKRKSKKYHKSRRRHNRRDRYSSSDSDADDELVQEALMRQETEFQQQALTRMVDEITRQIDDEIDLKRQMEFEERIERRIQTQNELFLSKTLNQQLLPLLGAQQTGQSNPADKKQSSPTAKKPMSNRPSKFKRHVSSDETESPIASPTNAKADAENGEAEVKPKNQSKSKTKSRDKKNAKKGGKENEDRSIWENLLDEESELLNISDDELEVKEKERIAREKEREEKKMQKQNQYKQMVRGLARPLYRWRAEGVNNPAPEQVLKGRRLFRSIGLGVLFTTTLKVSFDKVKKTHVPDDISEMKTALAWFMHRAQLWFLQTLETPLHEILTKPNVALDPSQLSIFKSSFRKKKNSEDTSSASKLALRLRVRIRTMFQLILRSLEKNKPPINQTIFSFFKKMLNDGCVFPKRYLFQHEIDMLDMSKHAYTRWMVQVYDDADPSKRRFELARQRQLLANFLFVRCFIPVLQDPSKLMNRGSKQRTNSKVRGNLMTLATIFYRLNQKSYGGPTIENVVENRRNGAGQEANAASQSNAPNDSAASPEKKNKKSMLTRWFSSGPKTTPQGNDEPDTASVLAEEPKKGKTNKDKEEEWFVDFDEVVGSLYTSKHFNPIADYMDFAEELQLYMQVIIELLLEHIWKLEPSNNFTAQDHQIILQSIRTRKMFLWEKLRDVNPKLVDEPCPRCFEPEREKPRDTDPPSGRSSQVDPLPLDQLEQNQREPRSGASSEREASPDPYTGNTSMRDDIDWEDGEPDTAMPQSQRSAQQEEIVAFSSRMELQASARSSMKASARPSARTTARAQS